MRRSSQSSEKGRNADVCKVSDVEKVIKESDEFAWSWCMERDDPLRHTAIVLYFDGKPRFTINFHPANDAKKVSCTFATCEGKVTIRNVGSAKVKYFKPFLTLSTKTKEGKEAARRNIKRLTSYKPESYDIFDNNCRKHVEGVVALARKEGIAPPSTAAFQNAMDGIRDGDNLRYATIFVVCLAILALAAVSSHRN